MGFGTTKEAKCHVEGFDPVSFWPSIISDGYFEEGFYSTYGLAIGFAEADTFWTFLGQVNSLSVQVEFFLQAIALLRPIFECEAHSTFEYRRNLEVIHE
jgi:hypothetical protein